MGKIAAVLPTYNEELTIVTVVLRAREYVDKMIIVNDGSIDKTSDVAKLAGAEVIEMGSKRGKASALFYEATVPFQEIARPQKVEQFLTLTRCKWV